MNLAGLNGSKVTVQPATSPSVVSSGLKDSGSNNSAESGYLALVDFVKKVAVSIAIPQYPNPGELGLKIEDRIFPVSLSEA